MNRYIAQGLVNDAVGGRKIIVVGSAHETSCMFYELRRAGGRSVEKAYAVHGRQRICFENGGEIRFVLRHGSDRVLQGMSADVVFIPDREDGDDPVLVESAVVATAAAPYGEVIRA